MNPVQACQSAAQLLRTFVGQHRGHLSAASMVTGFACDNVLLGRVDVPTTQTLLGAYIVVAAFSIALLHFIEARGEVAMLFRWRNLLPLAIQFSLGSVWSGLLVFYSRSAVFAASWPFLLLLLAIFIGNEVFNRYVARLVFSATLLFFAVFSFSLLVVPIYVHAIGMWVFLLSGGIAATLFLGYLRALAHLGPEPFRPARLRILAGVGGVFGLVNLFYFVNILPPLPLALADSGVYHAVKRTGADYSVLMEPEPWYARFGWPPTVHLGPGEPVYVFSSVFAPIELTAQITHRWEWYSQTSHRWLPMGRVSFTVSGGRDGGYRGYTVKHNPAEGDWRVDIETSDGKLIGRVRFTVSRVDRSPDLRGVVL